jgi:hypothetical protein
LHILNHPHEGTIKPEINVMLKRKFKGLFNSKDCLKRAELKSSLGRLPDPELPFRRLPWASDEPSRDRYLLEEASWRSLSVTWGSLPITEVGIIMMFTVYGGTSLSYLQLEVPRDGLTMGRYYDLLLSDEWSFGNNTHGWRLYLGKRLSSNKALEELRQTTTYPSDRQVIGVCTKAPQSAVLIIEAQRGCTGSRRIMRPDEFWRPEMIGDEPFKFLCGEPKS